MTSLQGRTAMPQNYFRSQNVVILGVLVSALALVAGAGYNDSAPLAPPAAPVRTVTDEYFGVKVADPYRYMEDLKNPEIAAWFKGQNDYTRAVLNRIPGRSAFLTRIKALDESAPARVTDLR